MLKCIRVRGYSMVPALAPGDYLLLLTRWFRRRLKPGRLVVFRHPQDGTLVKRIRRVDRHARRLEVAGDGALSAEASAIGPVPFDAVIGVGIRAFKK